MISRIAVSSAFAVLWAGAVTAQPATSALPPAPVPVPAAAAVRPGWIARGAATLQALDKVYARTATLTVRRAEAVRFGALDIAVLACHSRPPDQALDAAAFLVISERETGVVRFRGWMFANNPAIAILEHPIYGIRVLGCVP
ncbi:MAG: DUF2155 domain-containing protein [Acetobacteraceae bacterium]|nr:DUF2155 domain-containing protein [Acetobacteraceae bacterium]